MRPARQQLCFSVGDRTLSLSHFRTPCKAAVDLYGVISLSLSLSLCALQGSRFEPYAYPSSWHAFEPLAIHVGSHAPSMQLYSEILWSGFMQNLPEPPKTVVVVRVALCFGVGRQPRRLPSDPLRLPALEACPPLPPRDWPPLPPVHHVEVEIGFGKSTL